MPFLLFLSSLEKKYLLQPFEVSEKDNVGLCVNMLLFKMLDQAGNSSENVQILTATKEKDITLVWKIA